MIKMNLKFCFRDLKKMYFECQLMVDNYYFSPSGRKKITLEVTLLETAINYDIYIEENGSAISKRISTKNLTQVKTFNFSETSYGQKKIYLKNSSGQIFDPSKILSCKYRFE